jgi:phosphoribosylformylglycinamidine cyclo-ligase
MALDVHWGTWPEPAIFDVIRKAGTIAEEEMRHVFNLGVGLVLLVDEQHAATVMSRLAAASPFVVGRVIAS